MLNLSKKICSMMVILALAFSLVAVADNTDKDDKDKTPEVDVSSELITKVTEQGEVTGKAYALEDYGAGLPAQPSRHFNGIAAVAQVMHLDMNDPTTKRIAEAFLKAYQQAYNLNYQKQRSAQEIGSHSLLFNDAEVAATVDGKVSGYYDCLNSKSREPEGALAEMKESQPFAERFSFDLLNIDPTVEDRFDKWYDVLFRSAYFTAYDECHNTIIKQNGNFVSVDAEEKTIAISTPVFEASNSGITQSTRPEVSVKFPAGTVGGNCMISLANVLDGEMFKDSNYVPLSGVYSLIVKRGPADLYFNKQPEITVNGYGVRGAGVYKYSPEGWLYMYTKVEDGKLTAKIRDGEYNGDRYAVMVDYDFFVPNDISHSDFFEDITVAARRHIIPQVKYYAPNKPIKRVDLAYIIYHTMKTGDKDASDGSASDIGNLPKSQREAIKFVVANGYMKNASGRFRPGSEVTYGQFKNIFDRLIEGSKFDLAQFSDELKRKRMHRTGFDSRKSNKITKGEAVYAFVNLLD